MQQAGTEPQASRRLWLDRTTILWVLLLLVGFGTVWAGCVFVVVHGGSDPQLLEYTGYVGCFLLLACGYLVLHGLQGTAWFSAPVIVTLYFLFSYIALPASRFISGDEPLDPYYVQAMFLTLIGLAAFWAGSIAIMKPATLRYTPSGDKTPLRVSIMAGVCAALGIAGKIVMWKVGLFSYLSDRSTVLDSLWYVQWLTYIAGLLNWALIVAAIEVFGKKKPGAFIRVIFTLVLMFALGFGLISGFKGELLFPLLYLLMVYGFTRRRLPKVALLFPLLPILIYPFGDAYRRNLDENGYRDRANTVDGLIEVLGKSFTDVVSSNHGVVDEGASKTSSRLSDLTYVHDMMMVPDPAMMASDEKLWLAPIYPFIPRVIWPTKPVFNAPQRLSIALGRPETMSSAVPLLGDLDLTYGVTGVVLGLFIYGLAYQLYMNWATRSAMSERRLFFYMLMLFQLMGLGGSVIISVANWLQVSLVLFAVSYFIYGRRPSAPKPGALPAAMSLGGAVPSHG